MSSELSIGVVILTLNAKKDLIHCLPFYLGSPLKPRVLVVDSESTDGTAHFAEQLGAEVLHVERKSFNHGLTREMARRHLGTDIVIMATPDAHPQDVSLVEQLTLPIRTGKADAAYARQLPRKKAGFFEAFAREFNYPKEGHIRSLQDIDKYGTYTFFCSNSCAAYSNHALDRIGGFKSVLLGEDTVATAELLQAGCHIAYAADAMVYHSHGYSLLQEFKRYFDTGFARHEYRRLIGEGDSKRGKEYTVEMFRRLAKEKPYLLPYGALQVFVKAFGFYLGKNSMRTPRWFKRKLSGHKAYW